MEETLKEKEFLGRDLALNCPLEPEVIIPNGCDDKGKRGAKKLEDNEKLIHKIGEEKNLITAYEMIKSNLGNMVRGSTKETLDGLSKKWIEDTSKMIVAGKYRFNPTR